MQPQGLEPILTAHLFPALEAKLIELLRSLTPSDWEKQTLAPKWRVKHVAAHLLDTQLRTLSVGRDRYTHESGRLDSYANLVAFVDKLNEEGVAMYSRLSPRVLVDLMEQTSAAASEYLWSLDLFAMGTGVSWAGEMRSASWFHIAREFTERWHHQQQIRVAVEKPGIMIREFYFPVLDCFMRALPYRYRNIVAKPNSLAQFNITGECGGSWYLYRADDSWKLIDTAFGNKVAETSIPQEIAWQIFTKGMSRDSARLQTQVNGDADIALHILGMIAIVG